MEREISFFLFLFKDFSLGPMIYLTGLPTDKSGSYPSCPEVLVSWELRVHCSGKKRQNPKGIML